jgi:hypothetical protein
MKWIFRIFKRPKKISDADISLVKIRRGKPHCKVHGAMIKLTPGGIWRCQAVFGEGGRNFCFAGCEY